MKIPNPKMVYSVAKKEFLDNIRNRWILIISILFFLIVIGYTYVATVTPIPAGTDETEFFMQTTITGLLGIAPLLIPLIAVILGFNTIAGEAESGSLTVVLSYPVRRIEVLLGKLLGLGSVITLSTVIGFGIGGIIVLGNSGGEYWLQYLAFIGLTILLGFVFLSLTIFVSSIAKKRIYAIGGGIIIFFWGMIIGTVVLGILYGSGYDFSNINDWPDWFWNSVYLSPGDLYQTTVQKAFGFTDFGFGDIQVSLPPSLSLKYLISAHFIWFIVPLTLSYYFFKKRDI